MYDTETFEKVTSPRDLLKIFGPAGGSCTLTGAIAPEGGARPNTLRIDHIWLVETENSEAPSYSNTL